MNIRSMLLLIACALSGCATKTSIKYEEWDGYPTSPSQLKFALQESMITLLAKGTEKDAAAGFPPKAGDLKCAANGNWWDCFNNAVAHSVMTSPNNLPPAKAGLRPSATDMSLTKADTRYSKVYVATQDDASMHYFSTTTISGALAPGQDYLYTQVTVKYTDNKATIMSSAGSGAALGFGIGGPAGAVGGLVLGAAAAAPHQVGNNPAGGLGVYTYSAPIDLGNDIEKYLCNPDEVIFSALGPKLTPVVYLPLSVDVADARPMAASDYPAMPSALKEGCWRALPNAALLSSNLPVANEEATKGRRAAVEGDGWLYRFVAVDELGKVPPGAEMSAAIFFDDKKNPNLHHSFPYSSCRRVALQITWWEELLTASVSKPRMISFRSTVADPDYVSVAHVEYGGVINFKPDCGANVSMVADSINTATTNAAISLAQKINDANQAWKKAQAAAASGGK